MPQTAPLQAPTLRVHSSGAPCRHLNPARMRFAQGRHHDCDYFDGNWHLSCYAIFAEIYQNHTNSFLRFIFIDF